MPNDATASAKPDQHPSTKGERKHGSHQDPVKMFEGHQKEITSIATFPDGERIATGSLDKTIRIWRLKDGMELMKWRVEIVWALLILRNGMQVISAEKDDKTVTWRFWVRDAEAGGVVAGPLDGHTNAVEDLDISPDGEILAMASGSSTVILWDTTTWQRHGLPLDCGAVSEVNCVRFSPSGQLAVATFKDIQIWDLDRRECLAQFKGHCDFHINASNYWLTWTRDGAHLLSAGNHNDPVIRSWDTSTWKQAGDPWTGHKGSIHHITLNPAGTLLASASEDHTVRLWQLLTGTEVARYEHSDWVHRVQFSVDGCFIFSGGWDKKISQWKITENVLTAAHGDMKNEATPHRHITPHTSSGITVSPCGN